MAFTNAGPAHSRSTLLPRTALQVGTHAIQAEIANTPESRQQGLMGRAGLPDNQGMLFVFDDIDVHCFWMKDTPLPLSIAFITREGRITSITDMQPYSEDVHCPDKGVLYALEMPQGWFAKAGVHINDRVTPLPPLN